MLGKHNPLPLYLQLKAVIEDRIASGDWLPGTQLPSERELCEQFKISRITVRQAITDLVTEGRLIRTQGRGTFVASPRIEQRLSNLTGFTQDMQARGQRPGSKVIQLETALALPNIARALQLKPGDCVVVLKRLRLADGEPVAVETGYFPDAVCHNLINEQLDGRSLYDTLRKSYNIQPTRAEQQLAAIACPAAEARAAESPHRHTRAAHLSHHLRARWPALRNRRVILSRRQIHLSRRITRRVTHPANPLGAFLMITATSGIDDYFTAITALQHQVFTSQREQLHSVAQAMTDVILRDGRIFTFGTGHSHLLAEESHFRAGGLANAVPMLLSALMLHEGARLSSDLERTPGVARAVFNRYQPQAGEMIFIYSNSGVNVTPVEMALVAKEHGLLTVAVCSLAYARVAPLSNLGQRLPDVADYVIDNGGQPGDGLIALDSSAWRVGPTRP